MIYCKMCPVYIADMYDLQHWYPDVKVVSILRELNYLDTKYIGNSKCSWWLHPITSWSSSVAKYNDWEFPTKQIFVEYSWNISIINSQNIWKKFPMKFREIFPNNVPGILFVEYSWNIPMMYSQNILKKSPLKFWGIFPNNVPGILNIGYSLIVPWISYECYIYFLGGSRNTIVDEAVTDICWVPLKIWCFHESLASMWPFPITVYQLIITVITKFCKVVITYLSKL